MAMPFQEEGSTLKGKNLLLPGKKYIPLSFDFNWEGTEKGGIFENIKTASHKSDLSTLRPENS